MTSTSLFATSLVSGAVGTSANVLGAPDGVFTTDTGNTNYTARFDLGTLAAGQTLSGTQTLRVRIRRDANAGNAPTINSVTLFEAGISRAVYTGIATPASTTAEDRDFTFADTLVVATSQLAVEISVSGSGGNGALRRTVQLDSITWLAEHVTGATGPQINYWNGTAWVLKPLKRWDGAAWVNDKVLKYWNGTAWVVAP
jgi:hypothetical protein